MRFNDARTYSFCFDGIEPFKTVAIGTHGCIKRKEDKTYFKHGLRELIRVLHPKTILVYGAVPDDVFAECREKGIKVIPFESEYSKSRRQGTA